MSSNVVSKKQWLPTNVWLAKHKGQREYANANLDRKQSNLHRIWYVGNGMLGILKD
jgi:hypothetical protein